MSKPEEKHEVTLSFNGKAKSWGMGDGNGPRVAPDSFPKIKVKYGHEGKLTFKIVDSPGVTFAKDNPILAAPVTNPASKPSALDPQFAVEPSGDPSVLVVRDLNGVPGKPQKAYDGGDYNYVLNFENAPPIDPIISNTGCCKPTGFQAVASFLGSPAGVALMVALVAVIAWSVMRGRSRASDSSDAA